jgi:hypothetical protein
VATIVSIVVGGIWVYRKYVRQQERYPNIEFTADINLLGIQGEFWIAELIAIIDNKGKAQHRFKEFHFDLSAIEQSASSLRTDERWGNQVDFPAAIANGSFLPAQLGFFFVDPGIKAKYSYITRIPVTVSLVILHCWFKYSDGRRFSHAAERTIAIPRSSSTLASH